MKCTSTQEQKLYFFERRKSKTIKCSYIWRKHFHSLQIDIFDLYSFHTNLPALVWAVQCIQATSMTPLIMFHFDFFQLFFIFLRFLQEELKKKIKITESFHRFSFSFLHLKYIYKGSFTWARNFVRISCICLKVFFLINHSYTLCSCEPSLNEGKT